MTQDTLPWMERALNRHKSRICIPSKYRINVKIIEMVIIIYWHVSTKPAIHINHPSTHLTILQPPPGGMVFAFKRFVYHN